VYTPIPQQRYQLERGVIKTGYCSMACYRAHLGAGKHAGQRPGVRKARGLTPVVLQQLHDQGLTQSEIAERFGVTQGAIWHWMRKWGIDARSTREAANLPHVAERHRGPNNARWNPEPSDDLGRQRARKLFAGQPCEQCGVAPIPGKGNIHRHHRDENPLNNDPSNIAFLCASHHMALHQRRRREADPRKEIAS
jgi:hypothetical protein